MRLLTIMIAALFAGLCLQPPDASLQAQEAISQGKGTRSNRHALQTEVERLASEAKSDAPHPGPAADRLRALRELRRLKGNQPDRYIELMKRIQPRLNDPSLFLKRLERLAAGHPTTARKVRAMLLKTPVRGEGPCALLKRLRFLETTRPQAYIMMLEILFPEVRPQAVELYWLKTKGIEVQGGTAPQPLAPFPR